MGGKSQVLDLWEGLVESVFSWNGKLVRVTTVASPETDSVAVEIRSGLLRKGKLGIFFDFPYASGKNNFDAPFVGVWTATGRF